MNPNQTPCPRCSKTISKANIARHLKSCAGPKTTLEPQRPCPSCSTPITLSKIRRHLKRCNPSHLKRKAEEEPTPSTSKTIRLDEQPQPSITIETQPSSSILNTVRSSIVSAYNSAKAVVNNIISGDKLRIEEMEKAFKDRMKTYSITNRPIIKDPVTFLGQARELIRDKIEENAREENIKVNLVLVAEYKKPVNNMEEIKQMNFKTKNTIIYPSTDILEVIKEAERKVLVEMDEFYAKGSGWSLHKIIHLELRINHYKPLRGSSYMELPKTIESKRAVLNIHNQDHKCFLWSIIAAVHPVSRQNHPQRVTHYLQYEQDFDHHLRGINLPVNLDQVKLFEKRSGISVNVYAYDEKFVVYPLLVTDREQLLHVDLLYMKDGENSHYCLIKDLSRLTRSQITKHEHKTWVCRRCLLHFSAEKQLIVHKQDCEEYEAVKMVMPAEGTTIKFKDGNASMRVPFVAYADFESMLTPVQDEKEEEKNDEDRAGNKQSYTLKYQKHEAVSFCYYIVYSEEDYSRPVKYFGVDAARVFVESLLEESRKIYQLYSTSAAQPMDISAEDLITIANTEKCHICEQPFSEKPDDYKVRDHDHLTGKFRGMAHNSCNLQFRKPKFIPIFVHNLTGYDTHLFIKMFGLNNETIDVIPNNEERYISYTINIENGVKLRFLDSCRFMMSSLDKLAKNLSPDRFKHASKFYSGEQLQLLIKKGIYPYDFMNSIDKFQLTSLPEQKDFHNKLNMKHIEDKEYEHAKTVWKRFNIQNMQEYTLLYNESDVLLLADIVENFRDVCIDTYKLDPAWYFTAPGLAWSAMLRTTGIELELLSDSNMTNMIAKGIRGGVSQCSNRYAKANNPYTEDYDSTKPNSYLIYLDANNLYGWAMSQPMPYANFKWVENTTEINVMNIPDDASMGYILEVDLEYPQELHDLHSDLPLAPEQRTPPGSKENKLLLTLFDKQRYVVHYRNLKLYLSLGMKLKTIHRAISFSQKEWLKTYIDLNTNMRIRAKNEFEKDFFKLMNNSVFGKTMENIRNRVDIRLATKEKQVDKWMAQPNFKSRTIFAEQLAAIHMAKVKLLFNKAIYVGMSILDVSKILMFNFHYNVIKKTYSDKAELQYTDTDSLTYLIKTKSFYDDMKELIDFFDTSDYPYPNRYNMPRVNKKIIGKFKDELNGRVMYEHVGLRSKMYSSRSEVDMEKPEEKGELKKSKGVKKSVIKDTITFQDYKDCLEHYAKTFSTGIPFLELQTTNKAKVYRSMNMIRSYKHDLYSIEVHKIALSAEDDKRYIQEGGIKTLPWGHYKIPQDVTLNLEVMDALTVE